MIRVPFGFRILGPPANRVGWFSPPTRSPVTPRSRNVPKSNKKPTCPLSSLVKISGNCWRKPARRRAFQARAGRRLFGSTLMTNEDLERAHRDAARLALKLDELYLRDATTINDLF